MILTGHLIREARVLLGMSLGDLAAECRIVGTPSLGRIERCDGIPPISEEYAAAIQRVLEAASVEFIPENGGGAGAAAEGRAGSRVGRTTGLARDAPAWMIAGWS